MCLLDWRAKFFLRQIARFSSPVMGSLRDPSYKCAILPNVSRLPSDFSGPIFYEVEHQIFERTFVA
jgi:hypothetical protein